MSEPRVFHLLQRAHSALFRSVDRALAADGLSASQLGVLFALRETGDATDDDAATVSALARALALGKPAISGLVERMAAAGLVARHPRADDRRSECIVLTLRGRELADRHLYTARRFNAALLDGFDAAERAAIVRFLGEITAKADALAAPAPLKGHT